MRIKVGGLQLRVTELKAHENEHVLGKMKQEVKNCLKAKDEEVKGLQVSLQASEERAWKGKWKARLSKQDVQATRETMRVA